MGYGDGSFRELCDYSSVQSALILFGVSISLETYVMDGIQCF